MGFVIFAFVVIFVLIGSAGLLLFYREAMLARISAVVTPRPQQRGLWGAVQQTGFSVGGMVEQLQGMVPKSKAEVSVMRQRLIRAGYRGETALDLFYGAKVLAPLGLVMLALATDYGRHNWFFSGSLALGLGFLGPDFWLGRKIAQRQTRIRSGLPDVLDLIVICIEAGLSVDQATARTAEELHRAQPELSDELGIVVLEQRAGRQRSEAWRQFAERTAVDSVRNLVTVLVQSEQLGTSVAKSLRIHSETLRTQRSQRVEEQAAKTTIKLVFPLVLFIFPSLFLVTLGPALIIMSESFDKYLK
jgi:tight adherence protein C